MSKDKHRNQDQDKRAQAAQANSCNTGRPDGKTANSPCNSNSQQTRSQPGQPQPKHGQAPSSPKQGWQGDSRK
ncbi:MAG: hypothetical protein NTZ67_01520 [Gammaproteobacteria bacterium]|nr:hypothetical protein [Gammaproteobacteria bacterium]